MKNKEEILRNIATSVKRNYDTEFSKVTIKNCLNSLKFIQLIVALEQRYNIEFEDEDYILDDEKNFDVLSEKIIGLLEQRK